jgi:hypothetical protein
MTMKEKQHLLLFKGLAISLFIIFILDTLMHFVLVPWDTLNITWISFKGDIDFTTIGIINVIIRLGLYGWLAFLPQIANKWLPLTLSVMIGTTLYLMVDSWWVFENYMLLYGYWFSLLVVSGWVVYARKKPTAQKSLIMNWISIGLSVFIAIVYIDIMGLQWPREFVYAYFQRVVYEPLLLWLVFSSIFIRKLS